MAKKSRVTKTRPVLRHWCQVTRIRARHRGLRNGQWGGGGGGGGDLSRYLRPCRQYTTRKSSPQGPRRSYLQLRFRNTLATYMGFPVTWLTGGGVGGGIAKVRRSPVKRTKLVREGGGFQKNRTLGFKWCFMYTLVWELKPELRTFVRFGRREGVSVKLILLVSLGFYELLRWPSACWVSNKNINQKSTEKSSTGSWHCSQNWVPHRQLAPHCARSTTETTPSLHAKPAKGYRRAEELTRHEKDTPCPDCHETTARAHKPSA